jgi:hypothetical protein
MTQEKDLKFLKENFAYIFELSIALKELRQKYYNRLGPELAKIFISSIVRNYLLSIAALLDPLKDNRGNENISIYVLKDIDLKFYEEVKNKILTFRRKGIAHNDRAVMHQGDDFFKNYNLKPEEVENFFEYMLHCLETHLQDKFPREKITTDIQSKLAELFS